MQIISHRINTTQALTSIPRDHWVEVDVRVSGRELILEHDPFAQGELLKDWLLSFEHEGIVLNVKVDGLEKSLVSTMERVGVKNFFILDSQPATTYRLPRLFRNKIAVRVSDLENPSPDVMKNHLGGWAWLDCFVSPEVMVSRIDDIPPEIRICLASPEIMPVPPISSLDLIEILEDRLDRIAAVVTKTPEIWLQRERT